MSSLFNNSGLAGAEEEFSMTAVNVNILPKLWIPDLEIMDLMSFETQKILCKLEGNHTVGGNFILSDPHCLIAHLVTSSTKCIVLQSTYISAGVWIDSNHEVMYALASKITFICQMDFNAFPVDIQVRRGFGHLYFSRGSQLLLI